LFQGLETRQKLGTYALIAMILFFFGVVGAGYLRKPQPFPMTKEASSIATPPAPAAVPGQTSPTAPLQAGQIVSINSGTLAELDTLPNIGPVRAQAIIDYRDRIGGFKRIEEIQAVRGIGPVTYAKMLPYIRL
jgi:comEA protein